MKRNKAVLIFVQTQMYFKENRTSFAMNQHSAVSNLILKLSVALYKIICLCHMLPEKQEMSKINENRFL